MQIVSRPTRLTEHSASLIDHVYVHNLDSALSCSILTLDLSDHLATHTKISLGNSALTSRINITNKKYDEGRSDFRIINEANNEKFRNLIDTETWSEVLDEMDAQFAFNKFDEIYFKHKI